VTGVHKAVGLTGLALGGGYGKLNSRFGLVTDTLQRANVVVADGSLVIASHESNPDLFWALRGGGKNFGVVTSAEYSAFPLEKVLTGKIFFPLSSAERGLRILQSLIDEEHDALSVFSTFAAAPNGAFGLIMEPLWTGDEQKGEHYFWLMSREGRATTLSQKWCVYKDMYDDAEDAAWPKGRGYRMDAHNIPRLSNDAISLIVDCAARSPSDRKCLMLHDFHGAAARIPEDTTSFPVRRDHFNMQIVASWDPRDPEDEEKGRQWLEGIRGSIEPLSIRGAYPAILDVESHDRAREFYGDAMKKLRRLKTLYDPSNRFSAEFGIL
jgi:FAD/FMN-containing dehydrogenase